MPRFDARYRDCADFHLIVDPRPEGPTVGVYADRPFSESVADYFGRRFTYAGVAPRLRSGQYDLAALRTGEFIVEPGLLYRIASGGPKAGRGRLLDSLVRSAAESTTSRRPAAEVRTRPHQVVPPDHRQDEKGGQGTISPEQKRQALQEVLTSIVAFMGFALLAHLLLTVLAVG